MSHADSRTRLVDVLATGTGCAEIIDTDIVHIDFHIDIVRQFGHDIDGRKRRVPPCRRVERRNTDQAVHPFFRLQIAIGVFSFDGKSGTLDARFIARLHVHDGNVEPVLFCPARIHADQHLRPVLGFRSAGTGMEGQDSIARIVFARKEQQHFPLFDVFQQGMVLLFDFIGQARFLFLDCHIKEIEQVCTLCFQLFMTFYFCLQERCFLGNLLCFIGITPKIRITHLHIEVHDFFFFPGEVKVNPRFPVFSSSNLPAVYAFHLITQESPSFKDITINRTPPPLRGPPPLHRGGFWGYLKLRSVACGLRSADCDLFYRLAASC